MRIAVLAHLKHPIAIPFAGGLERFTHELTTGLIRRGHDVVLFASGDSDRDLPLAPVVDEATVGPPGLDQHEFALHQIDYAEDLLYAETLDAIDAEGFDVVHNNTLNPVVFRAADRIATPVVTTLHVPVLPRLARAIRRGAPPGGRFVNVSAANAAVWDALLPEQTVIPNGITRRDWLPSGGRRRRAVWFGRIVRDKGTHLAVAAAHAAGFPIDLAGPVHDRAYFESEVAPRLARDDRYFGPLAQRELCRLLARSAVAVVTPRWDEPFGLVVVEAFAAGLPVAGFRRGALPDLVTPETGRLAPPDDLPALAEAIEVAATLRPDDCRRHARRNFCREVMLDRYERLYAEAAAARRAA